MSKKQSSKLHPLKNSPAFVQVGDSRIHGQGVFAVRRIKQGTVVGRCKVKPSTKQGPYTLWDRAGSVDVICDLRFINHSEEPNVAIFEDLEVIALRDINKGEELTHHYGGTATLDSKGSE